MSKSNIDIDNEIERALNAEDREFAAQFQELGLFGQLGSLFVGKMAWVSVLSMIAGTIMTGVFFYTAWQFFNAADAATKLHWAGISLFLSLMLGFMKVWFWIRMESNRVVREVKRVELQLARHQMNS